MSLKTDYVDDVYSGSRKYSMTENSDGTYSFTDETEYTQTGDTYGAAEINELNSVVNEKGVVVSSDDIDTDDRVEGNLYFFYSE